MYIQMLKPLQHVLGLRRKVYLDHNGTTPLSRNVKRKMRSVLKSKFGNPSSLYGIARDSAQIIEEARSLVADAIHAFPGEVIFTGCATESNNAVLKYLSEHFYPEKNKIISTPIEHPSVMETLTYLESRGIKVEYCPVDDKGRVMTAALEEMIDKNTFLVCCMLANNEIGTLQNIPRIVEIAHKNDVLVLSDGVQALGKIRVDVHELGVDYASFSAHKLHGPKGIGALYIKEGSPFKPLLHGGQQEGGMRAGTESVHNIAGFGIACRDVHKQLLRYGHILAMRKELIRQIKRIHPECVINSPDSACIPNTISMTFPGVKNSGLMALLDYHGIAVSAGSACSSNEDRPSHVLKAIGLTDMAAQETIRISLGADTSAADIRYTGKVIRKSLEDRNLLVGMISPSQLNADKLFDEQTFILDIRPPMMRGTAKSLPNSHLASFFSIRRSLKYLPGNKHILVVCQHGNLSFLASYYLKSKGFEKVSSLHSGISGWAEQFGDLYSLHGGRNVSLLETA